MESQQELFQKMLRVLDCCQWDENCAKFCEFNVSGECVAKERLEESFVNLSLVLDEGVVEYAGTGRVC